MIIKNKMQKWYLIKIILMVTYSILVLLTVNVASAQSPILPSISSTQPFTQTLDTWNPFTSLKIPLNESMPSDESITPTPTTTAIIQPTPPIQPTNNQRLENINTISDDFKLLTITLFLDNFPIYIESAGVDNPIYEGNDIPELVRKINKRFDSVTTINTIYLDMKDFSNMNMIEAFDSSVRIQQNKINPNITIKPFPRQNGSTDAQDFFFSDGTKCLTAVVPEPVLIQEGLHRGMYFAEVEFGKEETITRIGIFASSSEIVREFLRELIFWFSSNNTRTNNLSKVINEVRTELKSEYKLKDNELLIQFTDQFGGTQFVLLTPEKNTS